MKRLCGIISVFSVLAVYLCLPACNTSKGFGKDVEQAGTSMKESAERNGAD